MEDIYALVGKGREIAKRIRARAKEVGRPLYRVLHNAGVGPSFVKDLDRNPNASPRTENLVALARELDVPLEWLAEGRGSEGRVAAPALPPARSNAAIVDVPEYDVQISAGGGALITDEPVRRHWGLPRSYLDSLGLDARQIAFVEIVGDSMSPALMPGDLVLLDLRSKNPALPAIYALFDGDATVCKRVEKMPDADPQKLRIISENKAYSAYEALAEHVNIIGRVAWFARRT